MTDKKYSFLEAFGEIDENYLEQAMQPWKKEANPAAGGRKLRGFLLKAACVALVATLGTAVVFQGQVKTALAALTSTIADILGISNDLEPYTDVINQTQTKDGVSVTLKEVILSGNTLIAAFEAQAEDGEDAVTSMGSSLELTVDGETIDCSSHSVVVGDELELETKNPQRYVMTWEAAGRTVGDGDVELDLEATAYQGHELDEEGTSFAFAFTASAEELMDETLYMFPERKIQTEEGVELDVYNVTLNSVMSEISAETTGTELSYKYQYYFIARDSLGNQAEYTLVSEDATGYEDENGETRMFYTFRNIGNPPSMESEWIEFQLYRTPLENVEESVGTAAEGGESGTGDYGTEESETQSQTIGGTDAATGISLTDEQESEGGTESETEMENESEEYGVEGGVFTIDPAQDASVGESFRVKLSEAGTTQPVDFYDADGTASTYRVITKSAAEFDAEASFVSPEEGGSPDTPQAGDVYWEKLSDGTAGYQHVIRSSETGAFMTEELTSGDEKIAGEVGDTVEIGGIRCKVTASENGSVMTAREIRE